MKPSAPPVCSRLLQQHSPACRRGCERNRCEMEVRPPHRQKNPKSASGSAKRPWMLRFWPGCELISPPGPCAKANKSDKNPHISSKHQHDSEATVRPPCLTQPAGYIVRSSYQCRQTAARHFKVIPERHRNLPVSTEGLCHSHFNLLTQARGRKKKTTTLANALLKDHNRSFPDC